MGRTFPVQAGKDGIRRHAGALGDLPRAFRRYPKLA
jgi:hypothetical protein